jgi:hypothetical protein
MLGIGGLGVEIEHILQMGELAPDVVEEAGRQSAAITLAALMTSFPLFWKDQRQICC